MTLWIWSRAGSARTVNRQPTPRSRLPPAMPPPPQAQTSVTLRTGSPRPSHSRPPSRTTIALRPPWTAPWTLSATIGPTHLVVDPPARTHHASGTWPLPSFSRPPALACHLSSRSRHTRPPPPTASNSPKLRPTVHFSERPPPRLKHHLQARPEPTTKPGSGPELFILDLQWGRLFTGSGEPTTRLSQILCGLTNYIVRPAPTWQLSRGIELKRE